MPMSKKIFTIEFAVPKAGAFIHTDKGYGIVDKVEGDQIFVILERIVTDNHLRPYNYVTVKAVPKVSFVTVGHA
jgi:hypothetical protein